MSSPPAPAFFKTLKLKLELFLLKVLSLDDAIQEAANKLRRNLLKLIGVGEFGSSAEWRDPCISFVLPEVS